jgi:hypothetical protein
VTYITLLVTYIALLVTYIALLGELHRAFGDLHRAFGDLHRAFDDLHQCLNIAKITQSYCSKTYKYLWFMLTSNSALVRQAISRTSLGLTHK